MINKDFSVKEMMIVIKRIEHELSGWKYYESINGKSPVAAMFFVFLKYIDDKCPLQCDDLSEATIFKEMKRILSHQERISNSLIYRYIKMQLETWNDDGSILMQYVQRIDFEKLPEEFLNIINILDEYTFKTNDTKENLIYAILTLYSSLYGNQFLKNSLNNSDLDIIISAAELLQCNDGMEIYDFSCGTGSLLAISSTTDCTIYGQERDFEKAVIAYMLLRITGVDTIHIEVGDVLQNPMTSNYPGKLYDRIISAPPCEYKEISSEKLNSSKFGEEFLYGDSLSESGFWIYARHIVRKLKDDGKGVLIAPVSLLSREGVTKEDRVRLAKDGSIEAIIQLPSGITSTAVKLCMIILRKGPGHEDAEIQLIDLKESHIERGNSNRTLDHKKVAEIVNNKECIEGICTFVSLYDMEERGMNFTPALYLRTINEYMAQKENTIDILEKQKELLGQYRISEEELEKAILNYYQLWNNKDRTKEDI